MFHPTFLYIKQHSITNKLYFGKTTKSDPVKYLGSGTYWCHHIKKYGREYVVTLWYCLFTDREELTKFALEFSEKMDIVKSNQWLNLISENGLDGNGWPLGKVHSMKSLAKMSAAKIGTICSKETRTKISIANTNPSIETRVKMAIAKLGKKQSPESNAKRSKSLTGKKRSAEAKINMSIAQTGRITSAETKVKLSIAKKGKPTGKQSLISCPHCNKIGGNATMPRWHFKNCKGDNHS